MNDSGDPIEISKLFPMVIMPVFEFVMFPFQIKSLTISTEPYRILIERSIEQYSSHIGLLYTGHLGRDLKGKIGTLCIITSIRTEKRDDIYIQTVLAKGISRFLVKEIKDYIIIGSVKAPSEAEIELFLEKKTPLSSLSRELQEKYEKIVYDVRSFNETLLPPAEELFQDGIGAIADNLLVCLMKLSFPPELTMPVLANFDLLAFLENLNPRARFVKIIDIWLKLLIRIESANSSSAPVSKQRKDQERPNEDLQQFKNRFQKLKQGLPEETRRDIQREMHKLAVLHPTSAEYSVSLEWLTTAFSLYELKPKEERGDIKQIQKMLDEDHFGLFQVKERVVEDIAVRILNPNLKGSILCFVGPPGTGKTSLGKSIARALNRKFVRWSAGGVRDEAEIRGHRRTYVGAIAGRIINALINCGSSNPIFMIDEVDKMGKDFRGDPASALLEALDPEQNHSFSDNYINSSYDLSKVFFIVTANTEEPIPPALKDRLEILRLPGYTEEEKIGIAREFLIPKQVQEKGLVERLPLQFSDEALKTIIRQYTREAGVRNLEREIAAICRKLALKITVGFSEKSFGITGTKLTDFLGPQQYFHEVAEKLSSGVAIGLAWTSVGGEIIFIEAAITNPQGRGELKLTGNLENVMKESAEVARSFLRSHIHTDFELKVRNDIHIHVPAGATPKDGPSAGVTILVALKSLYTKTPVKEGLAFTGEITLRGKILPVGGIKEKLIAADRAGIKEVIIPKDNKGALEDLPPQLKKSIEAQKLKIYPIDTMDEVLNRALPSETKRKKKPKK